MKIFLATIIVIFGMGSTAFAQKTANIVWQIGKADGLPNEFALAPDGFKNFVGSDFGYEDKFYLVNYSQPKKDFPYVLPGIVDTWGGTYKASGWRSNNINILFGLNSIPPKGSYKLVIKLSDYAKKFCHCSKSVSIISTKKFS